MGILVEEFGKLYEAMAEEKEDPLEELGIQYADYAEWQRGWLKGELLEEQLSYWEKQLAEVAEVHGVPLDHERPAVQTFRGRMHRGRDRWRDGVGSEGGSGAGAGDLVHGAAGSVCAAAVALREHGGRGDGDAGGQSWAEGTGAAGGIFCEHAGVADGLPEGKRRFESTWKR